MTESNSQQGLIVVESGGLAFGAGVSRNLTVNCFGGSRPDPATCEYYRAGRGRGLGLELWLGLGLELWLGLGLGLHR